LLCMSYIAAYHLAFLCSFFSHILCYPRSPLFPYTTLFRSLSVTPPHLLVDGGAARPDGGARARPLQRHPRGRGRQDFVRRSVTIDRKSTRLNSSHQIISYAVFCLKKKHQPKPAYSPPTKSR